MKNEICVAENALALEGEGGGSVAPGVGDPVDFQGKGTISRSENGQTYITVTEVNGAPTMGAEPGADLAGEEAGLDAEVAKMGGGMGGMLLALLLLVLGLATSRAADLQEARGAVFSGGAVSNWVAVAGPTQGFSVEIDNLGGSATLYLLVFDSATNSLAGRAVQFAPVPVPAGTSLGFKEWNTGAPMRYGVNVCLSTTPFTLTNATTGGAATVVHSAKN